MKRAFAAATILLEVVTSDGHAAALSSDPATAQIEVFGQALLSAAKLSKGRAAALLPSIEQTFNFSVMAQLVVGVSWAQMSVSDHTALAGALKRYTAARIASEIDHFANQRFVVDPIGQSHGPDRLVKTQFLTPDDIPVHIDYRMREYEGQWKVIDVYSDGVSALTTQRSDLASTLESGGAAAVVTKLQQAADQLH
jgi:phospholipid transport system substrate-binding protein